MTAVPSHGDDTVAAAADDARDPAISAVPTSESLQLKSRPAPTYSQDPALLPADAPDATVFKRDDWMLTQPQATADSAGTIVGDDGRQSLADLRAEGVRAEVDLDRTGDEKHAPDDSEYFASLGQQRIKQPKDYDKPDPEKLHVSSRELNTQFAQGKHIDNYATQTKRKLEFGSPGYQWRMMKLRKTYEQAEEEGRFVEEVALERYGDEASFQEAKEERQWLDRNGGGASAAGRSSASSRLNRQQSSRSSTPQDPSSTAKSFMFTDTASGSGSSTPVRSASFRRPGESSNPPTPSGTATPAVSRTNSGINAPRSGLASNSSSKPATPIPSVFAPVIFPSTKTATPTDQNPPSSAIQSAVDASQSRDAVSNPPMDAEALNKLEAKVLKAEMMGKSNAAALREKLEREKTRATKGGDQGEGYFDQKGVVHPGSSGNEGNPTTSDIQVLPTLDGRGRLYDVGTSSSSDATAKPLPPGNRRTKNKFETHDPKTGEFMRYNADDDNVTLEDMVRQEKFKAGSSAAKDYDAEISDRIVNDGGFREGFDYLDENAEKLARKKMRSDALKRQFAINDFAKTKKALESCRFCFQNEGESPPLARIVASGTRAYLAVPEYEPLVEGHSLIVPIQHHLSTLEAEDDTWDEIKNFMKCLIQQAADKQQGVVFYETVTSLKHQRHTCIEAVPLPHDVISALPGNFRQELLSVGSEWSTHHKIISFAPDRPFRRSMVSSLPYFMIQFDYKGEQGYGHVIEGNDAAGAFEEESDPYGLSGMSKGTSGGKFERYFAAEVIGGLLDLEPRQWMHPRRLDHRKGSELLATYKRQWAPFDWTKMLREQSSRGQDSA